MNTETEQAKPVLVAFPAGKHVSPETAYVVEDYPYGFRLRCKKRYWLERNKNGCRLVTQTTNPKRPMEVWNKPKASTYSDIGLLVRKEGGEEDGHLSWVTLSFYSSLEAVNRFEAEYDYAIDDAMRELIAGLKKRI